MKSLLEDAGLPSQRKASTANKNIPNGFYGKTQPFVRKDGTVGKDKTLGFHSRPGAKEKARAENRAYNKKARQTLKLQMYERRDEASDCGT